VASDTGGDDTAGDVSADGIGEDIGEDTPGDDQGDLSGEDVTVDAGTDADTADSTDSSDVLADGEGDAMAPTCEELATTITDQRVAINSCERSSQCAVRRPQAQLEGADPICFEYFNVSSDVTILDEAVTTYNEMLCSDELTPHCVQPSMALACIDGVCGECTADENDCPATCPEDSACYTDACGCIRELGPSAEDQCGTLYDQIVEAAASLNHCRVDDDCHVVDPPLSCLVDQCFSLVNDRIPDLPCAEGTPPELCALLAEHEDLACPTLPCECGMIGDPVIPTDDEITCVSGRCEFIE
jgi:hypothetical protein